MPSIDVELSLIEDKGRLVGFSLLAEGQTEAERFCASLPDAILDGAARFSAEGDRVTFTHPSEGSCSFRVGEDAAERLRQFYNREGPYAGSRHRILDDSLLTPGFKIVLAGMPEAGEKGEPIPSIR